MNQLYERLEPELRIRLILAKIRNVCYYKTIDDRPRAQYMHVFRGLRDDVSLVLKSLIPKSELYNTWAPGLIGILKIIPPKIKTHDCSQVANNLSQYVENCLNIKWKAVNYGN